MSIIKVSSSETRIYQLLEYLKDNINTLLNSNANSVNANMLSKNINNYSLDKIPTASIVERWIIGDEIHKDVYSFRSRNTYSTDVINNLQNIGFFEQFEELIKNNNEQKILPIIDGIQSIECLNCGTMVNANDNTAEFDIQIQINYSVAKTEESNSL